MTAALEGGEWSAARPGRTLTPEKTRYPFSRLGGLQGRGGLEGRSGRAENLVPTGIRSRTVQPVTQSLYRPSYRAHNIKIILLYFYYLFIYFQTRYRGPVLHPEFHRLGPSLYCANLTDKI